MLWLPDSTLTAPALFVAGAAASIHCSAMCGALSAHHARSTASNHPGSAVVSVQAGRVLGYALAGALAGALGQSLLAHLPDLRIGLMLQAGAALMLTLAGLRLLITTAPRRSCCTAPIPLAALMQFESGIGAGTSAAIPERLRAHAGGLGRGLLWALMPCGLLYSVLLLSALSGNGLDGALLAGAFAFGGSPVLAAIGWHSAGRRQSQADRRRTGWSLLGLGLMCVAAIAIFPAAAAGGWCGSGFQSR